jgi:hypothetical protein
MQEMNCVDGINLMQLALATLLWSSSSLHVVYCFFDSRFVPHSTPHACPECICSQQAQDAGKDPTVKNIASFK